MSDDNSAPIPVPQSTETPAFRVPWDFSAYCFAFCIVLYFYLFFSSRVMGFLVSRLVNAYAGRENHFSIGTVSLALLGGRLFFSELRYTTKNTSIRALEGSVTVRWWWQRVRQNHSDSRYPCRLAVHLSGLEYYIFNNSYRNDEVEALRERRKAAMAPERPPVTRASSTNLGANGAPASPKYSSSSTTPTPDTLPLFYRLFPAIWITIRKGNLTIGNPVAPHIMVWSFKTAAGVHSTTQARNSTDLYQILTDLSIKETKVQLLPNADFVLFEESERVSAPASQGGHRFLDTLRADLIKSISVFLPFVNAGEQSSNIEQEQGNSAASFTSYRTSTPKGTTVRNVLSSSSVTLNYYTDVAARHTSTSGPVSPSNCPQWGIDIVFRDEDTVANYGPWADANRSFLTGIFLPFDYEPMPIFTQQMGAERGYANFVVTVTFAASAIVRLPFDYADVWEQEINPQDPPPARVRPKSDLQFLQINVSEGSTVRFDMPMLVMNKSGYTMLCDVHLRNPVVSSSMFRPSPIIEAPEVQVMCIMREPVVWGDQHVWDFNVRARSPVVNFLYAHVGLLTELSTQWVNYPEPDISQFAPYTYHININLDSYEIFLNTNQYNVIDLPSSFEHNSFFILSGPSAKTAVTVDFRKYRCPTATVGVEFSAHDFCVRSTLPKYHTVTQNWSDDSDILVGEFAQASLSMSYMYHFAVSPGAVDSVDLRLEFDDGYMTLFGFIIQQFFAIQTNFMGSFVTVASSLDHAQRVQSDPNNQAALDRWAMPFNEMAVYLVAVARNCKLVFPIHLYTVKDAPTLEFHELLAELRIRNDYQDFQVDFTPSTLRIPLLANEESTLSTLMKDNLMPKGPFVVISDIAIHYHTDLGPMPKNLIYRAETSVSLGTVSGNLLTGQLLRLSDFSDQFSHHYANLDFGLDVYPKTKPDPVFWETRTSVDSLSVFLWNQDVGAEISLESGIQSDSDTLLRDKYHGTATLCVPKVSARMLVVEPGSKFYCRMAEVGTLTTSLTVSTLYTRRQYDSDRRAQRAFLREQDAATRRLRFLWPSVPQHNYDDDLLAAAFSDNESDDLDGPAGSQRTEGYPDDDDEPGSFSPYHRQSVSSDFGSGMMARGLQAHDPNLPPPPVQMRRTGRASGASEDNPPSTDSPLLAAPRGRTSSDTRSLFAALKLPPSAMAEPGTGVDGGEGSSSSSSRHSGEGGKMVVEDEVEAVPPFGDDQDTEGFETAHDGTTDEGSDSDFENDVVIEDDEDVADAQSAEAEAEAAADDDGNFVSDPFESHPTPRMSQMAMADIEPKARLRTASFSSRHGSKHASSLRTFEIAREDAGSRRPSASGPFAAPDPLGFLDNPSARVRPTADDPLPRRKPTVAIPQVWTSSPAPSEEGSMRTPMTPMTPNDGDWDGTEAAPADDDPLSSITVYQFAGDLSAQITADLIESVVKLLPTLVSVETILDELQIRHVQAQLKEQSPESGPYFVSRYYNIPTVRLEVMQRHESAQQTVRMPTYIDLTSVSALDSVAFAGKDVEKRLAKVSVSTVRVDTVWYPDGPGATSAEAPSNSMDPVCSFRNDGLIAKWRHRRNPEEGPNAQSLRMTVHPIHGTISLASRGAVFFSLTHRFLRSLERLAADHDSYSEIPWKQRETVLRFLLEASPELNQSFDGVPIPAHQFLLESRGTTVDWEHISVLRRRSLLLQHREERLDDLILYVNRRLQGAEGSGLDAGAAQFDEYYDTAGSTPAAPLMELLHPLQDPREHDEARTDLSLTLAQLQVSVAADMASGDDPNSKHSSVFVMTGIRVSGMANRVTRTPSEAMSASTDVRARQRRLSTVVRLREATTTLVVNMRNLSLRVTPEFVGMLMLELSKPPPAAPPGQASRVRAGSRQTSSKVLLRGYEKRSTMYVQFASHELGVSLASREHGVLNATCASVALTHESCDNPMVQPMPHDPKVWHTTVASLPALHVQLLLPASKSHKSLLDCRIEGLIVNQSYVSFSRQTPTFKVLVHTERTSFAFPVNVVDTEQIGQFMRLWMSESDAPGTPGRGQSSALSEDSGTPFGSGGGGGDKDPASSPSSGGAMGDDAVRRAFRMTLHADLKNVTLATNVGRAGVRARYFASRLLGAMHTPTSQATTYNVHVGPHKISFVSAEDMTSEFHLPQLYGATDVRVSATRTRKVTYVRSFIALESIKNAVDLDAVSRLLLVQSKVGEEISDTLDMMLSRLKAKEEARQARQASGTGPEELVNYRVNLYLEDFWVMTHGPGSCLVLSTGTVRISLRGDHEGNTSQNAAFAGLAAALGPPHERWTDEDRHFAMHLRQASGDPAPSWATFRTNVLLKSAEGKGDEPLGITVNIGPTTIVLRPGALGMLARLLEHHEEEIKVFGSRFQRDGAASARASQVKAVLRRSAEPVVQMQRQISVLVTVSSTAVLLPVNSRQPQSGVICLSVRTLGIRGKTVAMDESSKATQFIASAIVEGTRLFIDTPGSDRSAVRGGAAAEISAAVVPTARFRLTSHLLRSKKRKEHRVWVSGDADGLQVTIYPTVVNALLAWARVWVLGGSEWSGEVASTPTGAASAGRPGQGASLGADQSSSSSSSSPSPSKERGGKDAGLKSSALILNGTFHIVSGSCNLHCGRGAMSRRRHDLQRRPSVADAFQFTPLSGAAQGPDVIASFGIPSATGVIKSLVREHRDVTKSLSTTTIHVAVAPTEVALSPDTLYFVKEAVDGLGAVNEMMSGPPTPGTPAEPAAGGAGPPAAAPTASSRRGSGSTPLAKRTKSKSDITMVVAFEDINVLFECQPLSPVACRMSLSGVQILMSNFHLSSESVGFETLTVGFATLGFQLHDATVAGVDKRYEFMDLRMRGGHAQLSEVQGLKKNQGVILDRIVSLDTCTLDFNLRQLDEYFLFESIWILPLVAMAGRGNGGGASAAASARPSSPQSVAAAMTPDNESSSVFATVMLHTLAVNGDFGQSMGKLRLTTNRIRTRYGFLGTEEVSRKGDNLFFTTSTGVIDLQVTGRVDGRASMRGIAVEAARDNSVVPPRSGLLRWGVFLQPLDLAFDADSEQLVRLRGDWVWAKFRDAVNKKGTVFYVESLVGFEGLDVQLSCQSINAQQRIRDRFMAYVEEKRVSARQTAEERAVASIRKSKGRRFSTYGADTLTPFGMSRPSTGGSPRSSSGGFGGFGLGGGGFGGGNSGGGPIMVPIGEITVLLKNVRMSFFGYSLKDPYWAGFFVETWRLNLAQNVRKKEVHRLLTMKLAKCAIDRRKEAEHFAGDAASMERRITQASAAPIFKIPLASLEMYTTQRFGRHEINYVFVTDFKKAIHVSLNVAHYQYLQDITRLYSTSVSPSPSRVRGGPATGGGGGGGGGGSSVGGDGMSERAFNDDNESTTSAPSVSESGGLYTTAAVPSENRIFRCQQFVLEPQLHVLGDLTPKFETVLGWLGITHRDTIPSTVHELMTDNMEAVLREAIGFSELVHRKVSL